MAYQIIKQINKYKGKIISEELTTEAKDVFVKYHDGYNLKMSGLPSDLKAVWSKLEGGAARLEIVMHMARETMAEMTGNESFDCNNANEESMLTGVQLARWFSNEARRVYAVLSENDDQQHVRKLIEAIERKRERISVRDWQRSHSLKHATDAETQLDELVELGLVQWEGLSKESKEGRPSKVFVLASRSDSGASAESCCGSVLLYQSYLSRML